MELKDYQQDVLRDLRHYLQVATCPDKTPAEAFACYWAERGVNLNLTGGALQPYRSVGPADRASYVTTKVPTGGGKTLIACRALRAIFDGLPARRGPQVVVWFVPSDAILTQTLHNLQTPTHPYRVAVEADFGGRVHVVDKEGALQGLGMSPAELAEQLTICVFSAASFVEHVKKKGHEHEVYLSQPRARRENGNLFAHVEMVERLKGMVPTGRSDLFYYLSLLNPVVIVDESHNFTTELRSDMLTEISPAFVLNLTATPREGSNIISFVNAQRLKDNGMVKLPVIIYNKHNKNEVIRSALDLRAVLERKARAEQARSGRYVRPIVLFQAEPRGTDGAETFEEIRRKLQEQAHVPEEQIKLRIEGHDELRGVDLMSPDCPVRYIITVNALKEGWDCPFAYVLATVANRSSRVEVEQILGRILRQPGAKRLGEEMLNMSYVLTCSNDFNTTLHLIVDGMNRCGFGDRDYRVAENDEKPAPRIDNELPFDDEDEEINLNELGHDAPPAEGGIDEANAAALEATAMEQSRAAARPPAGAATEQTTIPPEIREAMPRYPMKECYAEKARALRLPNLYIVREANDLFSNDTLYLPVSKNNLLDGFDLLKEDRKIDLAQTAQITSVDLVEDQRGNYSAAVKSIPLRQIELLKRQVAEQPSEKKCDTLAEDLAKRLSADDNVVGQKTYKTYVKDVLQQLDADTLAGVPDRLLEVENKIKQKVDALKAAYAMRQFNDMCQTGEIVARDDDPLPEVNVFSGSAVMNLEKSLYVKEEGNLNKLEIDVIRRVAALESVDFWHRNGSRGHGFCINGCVDNHYPDFIVVTKRGNLVLIETKGEQLENPDSAYKLKIGKAWETKGGSACHYFMTFRNGAAHLGEAVNIEKLLKLVERL